MQVFTQELAEQFVRVWQQSNSIKEVEEKLQITNKTLQYRKHKLKTMGVKLKKHPRKFYGNGKQRIVFDINRLNLLAEVAESTKCP